MKKIIVILIMVIMAMSLFAKSYTGKGNWQIEEVKITGNTTITFTKNVEVTMEDQNLDEISIINGENILDPGTYTMYIRGTGDWTVTVEGISKTKAKVENKDKKEWPVIDILNINGKKITTIQRNISYTYKLMRADPFNSKNIKHELSLTNWTEEVKKGIYSQYLKSIRTDDAEGVTTKEIKNGENLDWMFSGGYRTNTRTLDQGIIKVGITHYMDENGEEQPTTGIKARSYTFTYKGKVYELLWFINNIGGVNQCGNLAGRTKIIKTNK